jgi:hypothetical protein
MRGVISRRGLIAATAILVHPRLALAAATTFPDFPAPSADQMTSFGDADLAIAAYPLTNAQDQKTYFGIDLSAAGVLPIWLSIANRSPAKRFLVDADDVKLAYGGDAIQEAERSRSSIDDTGGKVALNAATIGMAAGPIGIAVALPIMLMSAGVIARQDDVRRNLMVRQFYSRTIGPGQSAVGFVFGKPGRQDADLSKLRLSVGVKLIPAPQDSADLVFESALVPPTPKPPTP